MNLNMYVLMSGEKNRRPSEVWNDELLDFIFS